MNKQDFLVTSLISIAVLVLLLLGFLGGKYFYLSRFGKEIRSWEQAVTLGGLLQDKKNLHASDVLQAFHPDRRDAGALNGYSWAPLNLPTPFVGSAPAPGHQANASINQLQFRGEREVAMPKPEGVLRVFLTGGSTAYSSGAPGDDRTIGGYLEKELNAGLKQATGKNVEVFTLANPAWASTHERIAIENLLSELQPDLVVSLSGNNDVHWAELGRNVLWFRTYFDKHVLTLLQELYAQSRGIELLDNIVPSAESIEPPLVAQRLLKNVKLSAYALSGSHTPYLFALQPTLAAVSKPLTAREGAILQKRLAKKSEHQSYFRACYQAMDKLLSSAGIEGFHYLNLAGVFDANVNEEVFIDSYHFGDKGNEIIARSIAARAAQILAASVQSATSSP